MRVHVPFDISNYSRNGKNAIRVTHLRLRTGIGAPRLITLSPTHSGNCNFGKL